MTREQAWKILEESASNYAAHRDKHFASALSAAAKDWAAANGYVAAVGSKAPSSSGGPTIPFGRSKGTPIRDADTKDLQWVAAALTKSIDDPEKAKWADSNRKLLDVIEAELATR